MEVKIRIYIQIKSNQDPYTEQDPKQDLYPYPYPEQDLNQDPNPNPNPNPNTNQIKSKTKQTHITPQNIL